MSKCMNEWIQNEGNDVRGLTSLTSLTFDWGSMSTTPCLLIAMMRTSGNLGSVDC